MSEEDTLSQAELQRRLDLAHAEAEAQIQAAKAEKARLEALAAEAAALRRQKELVRSAAIGRRAQVSILMSEGAVPNYIFQVGSWEEGSARSRGGCDIVTVAVCAVQGRTALSAAAEGGHLTTVLALLKAGSSYDIENQACFRARVCPTSCRCSECLIARGPFFSLPQNNSLPPIVAAASEGYTEVMLLVRPCPVIS